MLLNMLLSDDYVEVFSVVALSRVNALLFMQVFVVVVIVVVVVNVVEVYVVVEYVFESMHTHIKLGAYALLNV